MLSGFSPAWQASNDRPSTAVVAATRGEEARDLLVPDHVHALPAAHERGSDCADLIR